MPVASGLQTSAVPIHRPATLPEDQPRKIGQWLSTGGGEVMNAAGARLVKILDYPLDLDKLHAGPHRVFKIVAFTFSCFWPRMLRKRRIL